MFTNFSVPYQFNPPEERFVPSFNRVLINCLSDQVLNFNFKYVVTLIDYDFPTGIDVGTIATLKFDPLPDVNAPIEFDVSRLINTEFEYQDVIRTFYDPAFNPSFELGFTNQITRGVKIRISEEWRDQSTGAIQTGVSVEDVFKVFPGAFNVLKLPFFDPIVHTGDSPFYFQNLSNQEFIFLDYYGKKNFCFFDVNDKIQKFRTFWTNTDGTTGFQDFIPTNQAARNGRDVVIFTFSPSYLLSTGFPKEIGISLVYGTGFETPVATIEVSPCIIEQGKKTELWRRVFWLNEYGTFDVMLFAANTKKMFDTKRELYQKNYSGFGVDLFGGVVTPGDAFFANTSPVFMNHTKEKVQIMTNWINDKQAKDLKNLFASSLVYLEQYIDEKTFQGFVKIPVKVTSSNYTERNVRTEKNIQVQIDLEISEPQFRQII